jgi:hypothetical protein
LPDTGSYDEVDRLMRQLVRADADTLRGPTPLPVGVAWDLGSLHGPVHVIDGDGASLCETLSAPILVPIAHHVWSQIAAERRCASCAFMLG